MDPDERLYATLMGVAGAAGNLELAFSLQDEMVMDGLRPSKVRFPLSYASPCSALDYLFPNSAHLTRLLPPSECITTCCAKDYGEHGDFSVDIGK